MSLGLNCPCGTGQKIDTCCGRFLSGSLFASTAEELMRSRYSAFATGHIHYLLDSWHPRTRPPSLDIDSDRIWTCLEVINVTGGSLLDQVGTVEFVARFCTPMGNGQLHENSVFERFNGKWHYVSEADHF